MAGQNSFLLVFDQFEELFSYPADQILEFKKQLAEALYSRVPKRYEAALSGAGIAPDQEDAAYTPFDLKVVFSIRSDRMSLLNSLKDYLPNLLQHGYELDALDEAAATEAVCRPAALNPSPGGEGGLPSVPARDTNAGNKNHPDPNTKPQGAMLPPSPPGEGLGEGFDTPAFTYAPAALAAIFAALRNERGRIETSTLQIVCRYVEDNVVNPTPNPSPGGEGGLPAVPDGDFNDGNKKASQPTDIPKTRNVAPLPSGGGAGGGVVHPSDLGDIKSIFRQFYERSIENLPEGERGPARRLVEDLLIKDGTRIPYAAQALLATPGVGQELLDRLAAASLLRVERDEQGRMLYEVGHDTLVAPVEEAAKARREAELREAEVERLRLEAERQQAEKQKIARARRRNAAFSTVALLLLGWALWQNIQLGKQKAPVVDALVKEVNDHIFRLEYSDAIGKLEAAARFDKRTPSFTRAALELVFYYNEAGDRQATPRDQALALLRQPRARSREACREYLRRADPVWDSVLMTRYYPVLLPVPGGSFFLDENYEVSLSNFQLARTETTVWQYNLYLTAQGKDIFDTETISRPGWGWEGDNPIVNVSWFDACLYANWLSRRFGLREVYDMGEVSKGASGDYYADLKIDSTANGFRLPTEAEWEYAARGGPTGIRDSFEFAGGNDLKQVGWYDENSRNRTNAVAQLLPNQLGLYDLSGNVWEWCWDWYGDYPSDATDPVPNPYGPPKGDSRVLRGGSWDNDDYGCGPGLRSWGDPGGGFYGRGFRVARH